MGLGDLCVLVAHRLRVVAGGVDGVLERAEGGLLLLKLGVEVGDVAVDATLGLIVSALSVGHGLVGRGLVRLGRLYLGLGVLNGLLEALVGRLLVKVVERLLGVCGCLLSLGVGVLLAVAHAFGVDDLTVKRIELGAELRELVCDVGRVALAGETLAHGLLNKGAIVVDGVEGLIPGDLRGGAGAVGDCVLEAVDLTLGAVAQSPVNAGVYGSTGDGVGGRHQVDVVADATVDGLHLRVAAVLGVELVGVGGSGHGAVGLLAEVLPEGLLGVPCVDCTFGGVAAAGEVLGDVHAVWHLVLVLRDHALDVAERGLRGRPVGLEDRDDHHQVGDLELGEPGLGTQLVRRVDDVERGEHVGERGRIVGVRRVGEVLDDVTVGVDVDLVVRAAVDTGEELLLAHGAEEVTIGVEPVHADVLEEVTHVVDHLGRALVDLILELGDALFERGLLLVEVADLLGSLVIGRLGLGLGALGGSELAAQAVVLLLPCGLGVTEVGERVLGGLELVVGGSKSLVCLGLVGLGLGHGVLVATKLVLERVDLAGDGLDAGIGGIELILGSLDCGLGVGDGCIGLGLGLIARVRDGVVVGGLLGRERGLSVRRSLLTCGEVGLGGSDGVLSVGELALGGADGALGGAERGLRGVVLVLRGCECGLGGGKRGAVDRGGVLGLGACGVVGGLSTVVGGLRGREVRRGVVGRGLRARKGGVGSVELALGGSHKGVGVSHGLLEAGDGALLGREVGLSGVELVLGSGEDVALDGLDGGGVVGAGVLELGVSRVDGALEAGQGLFEARLLASLVGDLAGDAVDLILGGVHGVLSVLLRLECVVVGLLGRLVVTLELVDVRGVQELVEGGLRLLELLVGLIKGGLLVGGVLLCVLEVAGEAVELVLGGVAVGLRLLGSLLGGRELVDEELCLGLEREDGVGVGGVIGVLGVSNGVAGAGLSALRLGVGGVGGISCGLHLGEERLGLIEGHLDLAVGGGDEALGSLGVVRLGDEAVDLVGRGSGAVGGACGDGRSGRERARSDHGTDKAGSDDGLCRENRQLHLLTFFHVLWLVLALHGTPSTSGSPVLCSGG